MTHTFSARASQTRKYLRTFLYKSSRGMTFSPTPAPGVRQLLLTLFLWTPVCIKKAPDKLSETVINKSYYRGTTQLDTSEDDVHLSSHTNITLIHAAWVTGTVPAGAYYDFRPASKAHSKQSLRRIPPTAALCARFLVPTTLSHRFLIRFKQCVSLTFSIQ